MNARAHAASKPVAIGLRGALLAACALSIVSCTSQPRRPIEQQSWEARRAQLQAREHFDLKARVAVAAGNEGFNARLRWIQQGAVSQLSLDGPLGVGGAQVNLDGDTLNVRTSRGQELSDSAARAELAARLGFDPPLRSLRYWIQGVPDPASESNETLDEQHRLAALGQQGWRIDYASYAASGDDWLPQKLTLQREGVRVRLLIDGWNP